MSNKNSFMYILQEIETALLKQGLPELSIDDIYKIVDTVREDFITSQEVLEFYGIVKSRKEYQLEEDNGSLPYEEYTAIKLSHGFIVLMY